VDADASFERLCALLADGHIVTLAFDWPGATATRFLGRPVSMASGTARLAHHTGALVVPMRRTVRRWRGHATFGPAIDPRDHGDRRSLHEHLATVHERWIREDPAALEDPRRPGCWGPAATSAGWRAAAAAPA
jgi:lauroyl/myristoyl acyltransferase